MGHTSQQLIYERGVVKLKCDTLAWATGTRVGAGDHAIALFCIECGRVLGFLYSDTFILHFVVNCAH